MIKWVNKKRNTKGFTLMELIIVIAILGILAAIALPRFDGFTDKAKVAADEATAATIENAIKLYVATGGMESGSIVDGKAVQLNDLLEKDIEFGSKKYGPTKNIYWIYSDGNIQLYNGASATEEKEIPDKQ